MWVRGKIVIYVKYEDWDLYKYPLWYVQYDDEMNTTLAYVQLDVCVIVLPKNHIMYYLMFKNNIFLILCNYKHFTTT